ncbi:MAG: glycoside hydrolase family 43 protein [Lachnospiraceae bacterium]|nr:glycoside hydrolase family 43 protein [Lachnospiraceae bacterium]
MKKNKLFIVLCLLLTFAALSACAGKESTKEDAKQETQVNTGNTSEDKETKATEIPVPTDTPAPTETPVPTDTPTPTGKPTPTPIVDNNVYEYYLMAYFTGNVESVSFATSENGYTWDVLNNKKPVLESNVGTTGVRDPFVLRSPDGKKFYILGTDLAINISKDWGACQTSGSKAIVVWESDDLVNWSEPRLCEVGAETAGCVWAPEATYLPEYGQYVVYWASRTSDDNYSKQRIWYCFTEDFTSFSDAQIWIDYPVDIIDTTVIKEGDYYYRFSKYEGKSTVILERSKEFFGEWEMLNSDYLESQGGVEGPFCFKLLDKDKTETANYVLLLDHYGGAGYYISDCLDLAGATITAKSGYSMPRPKPRHGSVIWLTKEEYERLEEKY